MAKKRKEQRARLTSRWRIAYVKSNDSECDLLLIGHTGDTHEINLHLGQEVTVCQDHDIVLKEPLWFIDKK